RSGSSSPSGASRSGSEKTNVVTPTWIAKVAHRSLFNHRLGATGSASDHSPASLPVTSICLDHLHQRAAYAIPTAYRTYCQSRSQQPLVLVGRIHVDERAVVIDGDVHDGVGVRAKHALGAG